jgi:PIN domain nuclease of toxin-antitoxin system
MKSSVPDDFDRMGSDEIEKEHALAIDALPPIHGDPFDRILIAQATIEGIALLTADEVVLRYPGPVRAV